MAVNDVSGIMKLLTLHCEKFCQRLPFYQMRHIFIKIRGSPVNEH